MNFKEALIAHLQGERVQVIKDNGDVVDFEREFDGMYYIAYLKDEMFAQTYTFRLAPRTIFVNGVEVPSPESEYPAPGTEVYVVALLSSELVERTTFRGSSLEMDWLNRGLIYIKEEDAIARAKAMLIVKEA